jgi:hypothetical protein
MEQAICIVHAKGSSPFWLNNLLESLTTDYPILVSNHRGWVMDGLRHFYENTDVEEMFFLNASCQIKDNDIWRIAFEEYRGRPLALADGFLMFMGKMLRSHLDQMELPHVSSKMEDVFIGETGFCRAYAFQWEAPVLEPALVDQFEHFIEMNGRRNMVLENPWIIKYKGHWSPEMIRD